MRYYRSVVETIGNTPLIRLNKVTEGIRPLVLAKAECFNPGGSVKDRIGLGMIEDAERRGLLKPGGTIVEPTSGNTGVGLAIVAALKGYKTIFVMPDKMSAEKIRLLKAYGAEVIVTPTAVPRESPESYYSVAERLSREIPGAFQPNQYFNMKNPEAHYRTTGPEIWRDTAGRVTHFVAGMGTGGTISGVAKYLKEQNPNVEIIGIDPEGSIYSGDTPRPYKVEGIGEDFMPGTMDMGLVDRIVRVSDRDAFLMARRLAREEGLLVGGSSGAAVHGALKVATELSENDVMVVLLPDTGRNYLSKMFSDEWMRANGFIETPGAKARVAEVLKRKRSIPALLFVRTNDKVRDAIELMREYDISQMPVFKGDEMVGSVSESSLLAKVFMEPGLLDKEVSNVMEKSFLTVDENEALEKAYAMLASGEQAVIVTRAKKPIGIVTKIDLIEHLSS